MTRTLAMALVAMIAVGEVKAQRVTTLDVGAVGLRYGDTLVSGGIAVSPSLTYSSGRSSVDASGTFSKFASGMSAQGTLAASLFTPSWQRLAVELAGSMGGSGHEDGSKTGQTRGSARLHVMLGSGGAWLGGGAGGMWDGLRWRGVREGEGGAWLNRGPAKLVASATPTVVDDTIRYSDMQATLAWTLAGAELGFSAGFRAGSRLPTTPGQSRAWGGASIVKPVTPRASIVLAAGSYPLDFTQGYPAGRYVSASMRFGVGKSPTTVSTIAPPANGVTRFEVRRLSEASIAIEVRAPSALSVEIMGDLTHWEPQAFQSLGGGRFAIVLPVTSSTSQVNIRVDGGVWGVPPGLTVLKDELGAEVGILVVPER